MLLDEDPAVLIHECIGNFNIAPDRSSLSRISSSLSTLRESRDFRLQTANSTLKKVSRQLNSLQHQHAVTVSAHNPTEHAASILALDSQKFRLAKEASAAEIESERLEGELRGCEAHLGGLERGETEGLSRISSGNVDAGDEQVILKLKLYRSLGIDIEPDADGQYRRTLVRNSNKGTATVIDIDPGTPRSVHTEQVWRAL